MSACRGGEHLTEASGSLTLYIPGWIVPLAPHSAAASTSLSRTTTCFCRLIRSAISFWTQSGRSVLVQQKKQNIFLPDNGTRFLGYFGFWRTGTWVWFWRDCKQATRYLQWWRPRTCDQECFVDWPHIVTAPREFSLCTWQRKKLGSACIKQVASHQGEEKRLELLAHTGFKSIRLYWNVLITRGSELPFSDLQLVSQTRTVLHQIEQVCASVAVLAEISLRSPRKTIIFIIKKINV